MVRVGRGRGFGLSERSDSPGDSSAGFPRCCHGHGVERADDTRFFCRGPDALKMKDVLLALPCHTQKGLHVTLRNDGGMGPPLFIFEVHFSSGYRSEVSFLGL